MVINRRFLLSAIGALIIFGLGLLFLISPLQSALNPHISYSTPYGDITVPAVLPDTPDNLTLYKVTSQPNDIVFFFGKTYRAVSTKYNFRSRCSFHYTEFSRTIWWLA